MKANQKLEQLNPAEKRLLGEALVSSADSETSASPLSNAQRAELRTRLAHHRAHPDEPGLSFQQLKAKLTGGKS